MLRRALFKSWATISLKNNRITQNPLNRRKNSLENFHFIWLCRNLHVDSSDRLFQFLGRYFDSLGGRDFFVFYVSVLE
jgi:hypothetical protein